MQNGGGRQLPVTLELGGKSPQIVFADADLDAALPFLVNAGIQNAGQTCSAGSRILVERSPLRRVVERLAQRYRALAEGRARLADLDLGPLISSASARSSQGYLGTGARRRAGSRRRRARSWTSNAAGGYYVRPTLVAAVCQPRHRLAQEEIFGPVQVVIAFDDEAEALRIANGTQFGLVAGVWNDGSMHGACLRRPGLHQQLRRRRRRGISLRRRRRFGHGREGASRALYGFSALETVAICMAELRRRRLAIISPTTGWKTNMRRRLGFPPSSPAAYRVSAKASCRKFVAGAR